MSKPMTVAEMLYRYDHDGRGPSTHVVYHDVEFRSRLEARFAFFLDGIGARWAYEPRRYGNYLPDFQLLDAAEPTFVEVKPTLAEVEAALAKMKAIWSTVPRAVLVVACREAWLWVGAYKGGKAAHWFERWDA